MCVLEGCEGCAWRRHWRAAAILRILTAHKGHVACKQLFTCFPMPPSPAPAPCPSRGLGDTWAGATWRGASPASSDSWQREPAQHPNHLRPRFPMSLSITKQPVQPHKLPKTCTSEVFLHDKASHGIASSFLASKEDHGLVHSPPCTGTNSLSRWPPEANSHQSA